MVRTLTSLKVLSKDLQQVIRRLSTSSYRGQNEQPSQITKHISLRCSTQDKFDPQGKPLVLLYAWLGAKSKHIDKYQNFYLSKGYDVASVKVTYDDILKPSKAQSIADDVITFASGHNGKSPVLAHCFSVGCYMYSEALVKINTNDALKKDIGTRMCGQVYDSPVDLDVIPIGMSNATTDNWLLNRSMRVLIGSYLTMTSPWITKHYLKASVAFKTNELKLPTLFLYSEVDPVCFPDLLEKIMNDYKSWDIGVLSKCWPDSKHVSHYHGYPEEYISLVEKLLQNIKMSQ